MLLQQMLPSIRFHRPYERVSCDVYIPDDIQPTNLRGFVRDRYKPRSDHQYSDEPDREGVDIIKAHR
ncbi:hypothetical protein PG993_002506 [Apiospora rasikravindrae]|uniref:Uncharacterized protein n=1 Tax=Apiospora rasikravindrae TaxID=990691 RepID=A0ABR1TWU4_9PEZI